MAKRIITCARCAETRPHHARGFCQPCYGLTWAEENSEKINAYARARHALNPEKGRASTRAWRGRNLEKLQANQRAYRARNVEKIKIRRQALRAANPEKAREMDREYRTGWTPEMFRAAWTAQGGKCAICGVAMVDGRGGQGKASVHADHDHDTGRTRALLCQRCNHLEGHVRRVTKATDPKVQAILAYQARWRPPCPFPTVGASIVDL